MKSPSGSWSAAFRQRLVLTAEEKRVIVFVLIAFLLGLSAKHYRDTHSPPPAKIDKKILRTRGARK